MKKTFGLIGVVMGMFCIFFSMIFAYYMPFNSTEKNYSISLSKSISTDELLVVAKKCDLMIRLVDVKSSEFGCTDMDIRMINSKNDVIFGKQSSVFPKNNINYIDQEKEPNLIVRYFMTQSNDYNKIEQLKGLLTKGGYNVDISSRPALNIGTQVLFSKYFIMFYFNIGILSLVTILSYYMYRLKEIGILSIHGYSKLEISFRILYPMLIKVYFWGISVITPFCIYIILSDIKLFKYLIIFYVIFCIFMAFVFFIASYLGTYFIYKINSVRAIKNGKSNKLLFYILLPIKILIVTLMIFNITNSLEKVAIYDSAMSSNDTSFNNLYRINTSLVPEESIHKKLDKTISNIDDKHIFNYADFGTLNGKEIKDIKINRKLRDINNIVFTKITPNILDVINIEDINGNNIRISNFNKDETIILIPEHFKVNESYILKDFDKNKKFNVIYIKSGQAHRSITLMDSYVYDSLYIVEPVSKKLYPDSRELYLDEYAMRTLENELNNLNIDSNSISIVSLKSDNDARRGELIKGLINELANTFVSIVSYILCLIVLTTIFLELRKREFGIYKILGRIPFNTILKFVGLNVISTLIIVKIINIDLLYIILLESIIYIIFICRYINVSSILSLKGE